MAVKQGKPPLTNWGILFVILGVLVIAPSGLCTAGALVVGIADYLETSNREDSLFYTGFALLVGAVPILFGVMLLYLGFRLRKPA